MTIVCISDTHNNKAKNLPNGDVLIHSGDWLGSGSMSELVLFCNYLVEYKSKYRHMIVVPGNHDRIGQSDPSLTKTMIENTGATYLVDQEVVIDRVKFYGSPWQPEFGHNWAWNLPRGEKLREAWGNIPDDVNVLITHGPPYGILDVVPPNRFSPVPLNVGCVDLLNRISDLKSLKIHVFGHIHESYEQLEKDKVTFIIRSKENPCL